MIRVLVFVFSVGVLFTSCSKSGDNISCPYTESGVVAPAAEIANLQAWITVNRPAAVQHTSGLFFEIVTPGTGTANVAVCSNTTVKYSGYLLNGTKFDENLSGLTFTLGQLILGWQKGLPLIKKGGTINLYIPPSLGYGNQAVGIIPANSNLIFNIQLIDVQ